MEWIGFSRNDPNQTKFVFDDSVVLTSEPPQYSIRFLESGEQGSILCSEVFKLKPTKPIRRKQAVSDTPEPPASGETVTVPVVPVPALTDDEEIQREIEESLKPKWRKQPDNTVAGDITMAPQKKGKKKTGKAEAGTAVVETVKSPDTTVRLDICTRHKYEYKTILDDLENTTQIEKLLNEYGEDGWDIVNFETTHSVFPNKSRLFCVLKRIKE